MKNFVHLDCTLRDGGYYNNWNFDDDFLANYFQAVDRCSLDIVEVGYKSIANTSFKGVCAFCPDNFIQYIYSNYDFRISIMLNISEFRDVDDIDYCISSLFGPAVDIYLVRLATAFTDIQLSLKIANILKNKGYRVALNLMQIANYSQKMLEEASRWINKSKIDVLYIADSTGNLDVFSLSTIHNSLKSLVPIIPLGLHAHDNKGQAFNLSMSAIDLGFEWVDSTIMGMGRGPGNAKTEDFLIEKYTGQAGMDLTSLAIFINKYMMPLQKSFQWGKNIYYHLAGFYNIHPSYIQTLLQDLRYSEHDALNIIDQLKDNPNKSSFNMATLHSNRFSPHTSPLTGSWSPKQVFDCRSVLVIGTGPSSSSYKEPLEQFITKYRPIVLALNSKASISESFIDYRAACHPLRIIADLNEYASFNTPLILPYSLIDSSILETLSSGTTFDYGLIVKENLFEFNQTSCICPLPLVFAYALSIATSGCSKRIYLAGFDGYPPGDPRSNETNHLLNLYKNCSNSIDLISITPTNHNLPTMSLYGQFPND